MNNRRFEEWGECLRNSFSAGRIWRALVGVQQGIEMPEDRREEMINFFESCELGREASRSIKGTRDNMSSVKIYQKVFEPVVLRVEGSTGSSDYLSMARSLGNARNIEVLRDFFYEMMKYSQGKNMRFMTGEAPLPRLAVTV